MSKQFTEDALIDIHNSPNCLALLDEIVEEFSPLPPTEAILLEEGEGDEGSLFVYELPHCHYRVTYRYPIRIAEGSQWCIIGVRPGANAHLEPSPLPPQPEEENIYEVGRKPYGKKALKRKWFEIFKIKSSGSDGK